MSRSALVALVAAAGVAATGDASPTAASAARPPDALADGSAPLRLPATVRQFEGRPVVGARRLVRPSVPAWCGADPRDSRRRGWLSPEGLSIVYRDPRSSLARACDAVRVRGRWARCSVGIARSSDPAAVERAGGALGVCSPRGSWRGFMWIAPNARSAWALVRRDGHWVAYPTPGVRLVRIGGTKRAGRRDRFAATVVFVDPRGRALERRRVLGYVAG